MPNQDMLDAMKQIEAIQVGMNPKPDDHDYIREARGGPCRHCADTASLRLLFYEVTEAFQKRPTRGMDGYVVEMWKRLYEGVRDTNAGLEVLKKITLMEVKILSLEAELDELKGN